MRTMARCVIMKRVGVFGVFLVACMLLPASAMAQGYLGSICWTMTTLVTDNITNPSPSSTLLRFDVAYLGGSSYTLQTAFVPPGGVPVLLTGGAFVAGDKVLMNLDRTVDTTASANGGWRVTGLIRVDLDTAGLNGTFWETYWLWDFSNILLSSPHDRSGLFTHTYCP